MQQERERGKPHARRAARKRGLCQVEEVIPAQSLSELFMLKYKAIVKECESHPSFLLLYPMFAHQGPLSLSLVAVLSIRQYKEQPLSSSTQKKRKINGEESHPFYLTSIVPVREQHSLALSLPLCNMCAFFFIISFWAFEIPAHYIGL